jgi:hypothetical protein
MLIEEPYQEARKIMRMRLTNEQVLYSSVQLKMAVTELRTLQTNRLADDTSHN